MKHERIAEGQIHIPYNWSYANAAARTGDTSVTSDDLGKFARQEDDNTIWMLTATTPTWVQVGGSGGAPGGAAGGDLAGTYPSPTVARASQSFALTGDISPSQITSNQNDYNPTGLSTAAVLRLSTDAARDITGLQGGADGRLIAVHNVGAFNFTLKDESGSSSASNRFALSADYEMSPDECCLLQYDATSSRWRIVGASPSSGGGGGGGAWSTLTDPSGNLSLTMAANRSTFTHNAATGSNKLWVFTTGTDDTGTDALISIQTPGTSNAKVPFEVLARGIVGFRVTPTGAPTAKTSGASNSERFGEGSSAGGNDSIAAGVNASSGGTNSVALGLGASSGGDRAIAIGRSATAGSANGISIGSDTFTATDAIAIGYQADSDNFGAAQRSIVIGRAAQGDHADVIVLGKGAASSAANQVVVGSGDSSFTAFYFGKGVTHATPAAITFNVTGEDGTDQSAAGIDFRIAGARGTGTGAGGSVRLQTAIVGSSGTSLNSLVDRLYVNGARKALTDASTDLFEIALPTLKGASCLVSYEIFASNGTDIQVRHGLVRIAAVNKAGAYTTDVAVVNEGVAASTGTLTATFAATSGSDKVTVSVTPAGSLTETVYYILYQIINNSEQAITIL